MIPNNEIEDTHSQKILSVTIDRKLRFLDHTSNLSQKVSASAMAKISLFHFYVPVWILFVNNRNFNNRINSI